MHTIRDLSALALVWVLGTAGGTGVIENDNALTEAPANQFPAEEKGSA